MRLNLGGEWSKFYKIEIDWEKQNVNFFVYDDSYSTAGKEVWLEIVRANLPEFNQRSILAISNLQAK